MGELTVAPCGHAAADYAVKHWHYSGSLPVPPRTTFGVWERGKFIGTVIYSRGASPELGSPYGLTQTECCELTRVALTEHTAPVSQVVAASISALRAHSPGLRLIVSYADPEQGHHGGIYQAGNWLYVGRSTAQANLIINGEPMHKRTAASLFGTASPERIREKTGKSADWSPVYWKHTYLMPLDKQTQRRIRQRARPYPGAA